jgi:excisionase family DNA binding protein
MANAETTWISKSEAAERLGCSEKTIDRLRAAGELVAMKRGSKTQGRVRIDAASLAAYEQREQEAVKPRPARADIEARFPIPELDQARAAKAARRKEANHEGTKCQMVRDGSPTRSRIQRYADGGTE